MVNKISRKKYYSAHRSKLKRKFIKEKAKISEEILSLQNNSEAYFGELQNDFIPAEEEDNQFHNKLRNWALNHNVGTNCLRDLLQTLNEAGIPFLPKDPATFLRTSRKIEIENIAGGQFWFNGISNNLRRLFKTTDKNNNIQLNFHVDGVQLFNSSTKQFWPILGQIHGQYNLIDNASFDKHSK